MSHPNHQRRRNRAFRVELLESRALLSTVFKGTFDGSIEIFGKAQWSTTGSVVSSDTKTVQGRAFAGVECGFNGSAKLTPEKGGKFHLSDGEATLINPQTEASLGVYLKGSTSHNKSTGLENITLEARKVRIGSMDRLLVGSAPFRLYPEGTFSATGHYNPDTAQVKFTFKFDVTKV
jgi:hypothetical protein